MSFRITKAWLIENKTPKGGWKRKQVEAIGLRWPLVSGWQDRMAGVLITDAQRRAFESFGGCTDVPMTDADASRILEELERLS